MGIRTLVCVAASLLALGAVGCVGSEDNDDDADEKAVKPAAAAPVPVAGPVKQQVLKTRH